MVLDQIQWKDRLCSSLYEWS